MSTRASTGKTERACLGEGARDILFTPSIFLLSTSLTVPFWNSLHPSTKSSKLTQRAETTPEENKLRTPQHSGELLTQICLQRLQYVYYIIQYLSRASRQVGWETGGTVWRRKQEQFLWLTGSCSAHSAARLTTAWVSACSATLGHHWRMGKVNWRVNLTLHPLFFRASNYMEP